VNSPTADPLTAVRTRVDVRLADFLRDAEHDAATRAPDARPLVAQIAALTLRGGKRLRPAMVVAAVECVTPWEPLADAVVDVAAAVELLQSYLLIHDDWMDGDTVRRGGPTAHVALAAEYGNPQRGAVAAILAGDHACALSQALVASPHVPAARLRNVVLAFVAMQREVTLGQVLDVLGSVDLDAVHQLKTGSYTVQGPLALGHALAGGSDAAWGALAAFARPLGVAFQLRDDLIGTFGDERETGKSASSDLRAGKRTAPVAHALAHLDAARRAELEVLLGAGDDARIARARALVEESGGRDAVEARIAVLRNEALAALETPALRAEGRALLARLARTLTERRA
jgi:geranylgeranyl diphosphate synthase type I